MIPDKKSNLSFFEQTLCFIHLEQTEQTKGFDAAMQTTRIEKHP